jgi:6-phosphofructokinase 1
MSIQSPARRSRYVVDEDARVPGSILRGTSAAADEGLEFELAGPRAKLGLDPAATRAAVVTCGGLCPGLNDVIRSLFLELHYGYGVRDVLGFRYGYQGLDPRHGTPPITLTPEFVRDIHRDGGTVLGTSRGPVDQDAAVEHLVTLGVNVLFAVGGDGTQRGAHAFCRAAKARGHDLAVVGIPKTIDNDVPFVSRTFGFLTAVEQAIHVLDCAHVEARSVENGVAIVKLMGRHAGFIAAAATVGNQDVNLCLVPEVPFALDGERGLLAHLVSRLRDRGHALVVVAEGAGQDLMGHAAKERDASGNLKLADVGPFLRDRIGAHCKAAGLAATIRYIDPSYTIRSVPADGEDSILCDLFARHAVHAAMAGKTGIVIGHVHGQFVHVPIDLITSRIKRLEADGPVWQSVLSTTGQPPRFE